VDRDYPTHWTLVELAKLRSMFNDKATDAQIAAELGPHRSVRAVAVKRHNMGLTHYQRTTRNSGDAMGWVARARHLEGAVDLAIALAETRADHGEIAEELRELLRRAPKP